MSIKLSVYNKKTELVGELKVPVKIFGVEANEVLVHQAMLAQMGNERQAIAHTKDRSEVRGGGRKPWRQKGTGRARAGSNRSPIWIGGGVTFGPRNIRNFKKNLNKKMRQKALFMVLSDRVKSKALMVIDGFKAGEYKTKKIADLVEKFESTLINKFDNKKAGKRSILLVNDKANEKIKISARNLQGVKLINIDNINILDLLSYRSLIITSASMKKLEKQYSK
ncbi:50S ribosomal protein L4 [bacterium]|nr:50S ribosomal protein L4 [bacterium]